MNRFTSSTTVRLVLVAVLCFGAGGATMYLVRKSDAPHPPAAQSPVSSAPSVEAMPAAAARGPLPDLVVPVSAELAQRAGIEVATVGHSSVRATLRVPGTVMPNQYRQVQVSSLVGGQVLRVSAELGDRVRRGAPMAQIFSSELAEAQTRYLSARAELAAADERLSRTKRLVAIGASSQQELEQTEADRTKLATDVEGVAAKLRLFGMSSAAIARLKSAADIGAAVTVTAPADGVITERTANQGVVVMPSTPMFVISSISPVWVIADVAERDLSRVRMGTPATVQADGAAPVIGKVVYISPDVRPETRTAQVRVETPNNGALRFGMLVNVELADSGTSAVLTVPDAAVQSLGGRSVVYLARADRPGEYIEREVTTGARGNGAVEIVSGLQPGDRVVTNGSFYVRAERERLGLRQAPQASTAAGSHRTVQVAITEAGFTPARVEVPAGSHVTLVMTRKVEATCGTDVVVGGRKAADSLPLNKPVSIDVGTVNRGEITFTCGMNMLKGTIVVQAP